MAGDDVVRQAARSDGGNARDECGSAPPPARGLETGTQIVIDSICVPVSTPGNIINNQASGGGSGDLAAGGGIFNSGGSLALTNSTLTGNTAIGGAGDSGGAGGDGIGGGLALENNSTATITNTAFVGNLAQGGAGGAGAIGGDGIGGGIAVPRVSTRRPSPQQQLADRQRRPGGRAAGSQWRQRRGGAFVGAGGSASLDQTDVLLNLALGGLAGEGGSDGDGIGGGLYVAIGAVVTLKKTTVALNFASTSNGDIYGTVTYL